MSTKPTYIGLLNAIANGERGGHALFSAWSAATRNSRLKAKPDQLLMILSDLSIDTATAAPVGRFIAEERDTGRLLRKAFKACRKGK